MDQESWLSCEKTAVLQGGFLLANQLCQPRPLSALKKEDWKHVGQPIVQAVKEICEQLCVHHQDRLQWSKRILCIIWSKVITVENEEDVDIRWRENSLFAVQNSLPDINHTVMFEVIKSMSIFTSVYAELLQCFEADKQCQELERLIHHVTSDSTEADVKLLLEVWWELIKGRREEDNLEKTFTAQCVHFAKIHADCSPHASKRFKPDPDLAIPTTCIVSVLFQGLNDIKENVTSTELCYFALSNYLDMLYTFFLLDHATDLPTEVKLQKIALSVNLQRKRNLLENGDLFQVICESQRDLAATLIPAPSKPCGVTLVQAMQTALEIICAWEVRGLFKMPTSDPSVLALRLKDSLCRVIKSLELLPLSEIHCESEPNLSSLKRSLKDVLASLTFCVPECTSTEIASVALTILDNNLKGFEDLPKLLASNLSQAFSDTEWLTCLERNRGKFEQQELVMELVSSLVQKCQSSADVNHCKKLKDIIVDIFSQLPLDDKNKTLSEILNLSKKGLHGYLDSSVTVGFDEELNMAFNCIIQGTEKSNLNSAISAVARVAFQNPEATMHRCCHMAIVNHGAHTLLAQILQNLFGLRCSSSESKDMRNKDKNLLCKCLQDIVWKMLSSPQEEDQFLSFLSALMEANITGFNGERLSFLQPEEAVRTFVLPSLSSSLPQLCSLELSLRLLLSALSHTSSDDAPHWIMNCSPFCILYCLAQLLNNYSRCWEQPLEGDIVLSIESKEMLISILTILGKAVGKEVALTSSTWSRALSWLYAEVKELDWTVCFHLKEVWGEHFKYEVPSSLLTVCELPEQEWSELELPQYSQGTGLLAWIECCCLSDQIQETMLHSLSLNLLNPEEVNMFSKGLLVAVSQVLPWCTVSEWERLLKVLSDLLLMDKLHVPYSLEYVEFLPLLDFSSFACDLRLSVFLLRMFQLLCGCSCEDWLPAQGWAHVGRLCAIAMRRIINSVKDKLTLKSATTAPKNPRMDGGALSREVLFVLTQLFCHVLHVQVMMPGQPEPLFLCALDILSHYEAVLAAYPKSSSALHTANTRHFLTTISDNLQCTDMRTVLHQKIAQL